MPRTKTYIQEQREEAKDEMTNMQVWKSDLEYIKSLPNGLPVRDSLHEILKNFKMLKQNYAEKELGITKDKGKKKSVKL